MISLYIIFITAVMVLFLGLNKKEVGFNKLSGFILIVTSALSVAAAKGWIKTAELESWAPSNMIYFGYAENMMVALLSLITAIVLLVFAETEIVGTDRVGLILLSLCGAIMMIAYQHMVMLFLGLEVLSIPLFVLAGSDKERLASNEAALKYFLMGAFSTAVFLLGVAFTYGATGSMELASMGIKASFHHALEGMPVPALLNAGLVLMSVGLLFKISAAPFHFWSPDVYEGSPNRVMAFMSTIVKVAAFYAFAKLLSNFEGIRKSWETWFIALSMITILWGNLAALKQNNIKRMMAYSSIAHAGYLMMFLLLPGEKLQQYYILVVYMISYAFSSIGLLSLAHVLNKNGSEDLNFSVLNGLSKKNPLLMIIMVIFVLSIAGIPITAGFAGKFYLFSSAWYTSPVLVLVGLLGSAISIGYYFKFIKGAIADDSENSNDFKIGTVLTIVLSICALVLVGVGVFGLETLTFLIG